MLCLYDKFYAVTVAEKVSKSGCSNPRFRKQGIRRDIRSPFSFSSEDEEDLPRRQVIREATSHPELDSGCVPGFIKKSFRSKENGALRWKPLCIFPIVMLFHWEAVVLWGFMWRELSQPQTQTCCPVKLTECRKRRGWVKKTWDLPFTGDHCFTR